MLESFIACQLTNYLMNNDLPPPSLSGFKRGLSSETAVLRVLSDILAAINLGDFAILFLLDLSLAFDMVDHEIWLQRLLTSFGIDDSRLE